MSKPIKIIFTLSLLLNLILVGVSAGCLWKRHDHKMPFNEASEQTRTQFRAAFEERRADMRADIETVRASRATLEKIIAAEPFDRGAYNLEVQNVLNIRDRMGQRRADILGDVLEKLTAEDRVEIAQKISAKLADDRPRRGGKPRGGSDKPRD